MSQQVYELIETLGGVHLLWQKDIDKIFDDLGHSFLTTPGALKRFIAHPSQIAQYYRLQFPSAGSARFFDEVYKARWKALADRECQAQLVLAFKIRRQDGKKLTEIRNSDFFSKPSGSSLDTFLLHVEYIRLTAAREAAHLRVWSDYILKDSQISVGGVVTAAWLENQAREQAAQAALGRGYPYWLEAFDLHLDPEKMTKLVEDYLSKKIHPSTEKILNNQFPFNASLEMANIKAKSPNLDILNVQSGRQLSGSASTVDVQRMMPGGDLYYLQLLAIIYLTGIVPGMEGRVDEIVDPLAFLRTLGLDDPRESQRLKDRLFNDICGPKPKKVSDLLGIDIDNFGTDLMAGIVGLDGAIKRAGRDEQGNPRHGSQVGQAELENNLEQILLSHGVGLCAYSEFQLTLGRWWLKTKRFVNEYIPPPPPPPPTSAADTRGMPNPLDEDGTGGIEPLYPGMEPAWLYEWKLEQGIAERYDDSEYTDDDTSGPGRIPYHLYGIPQILTPDDFDFERPHVGGEDDGGPGRPDWIEPTPSPDPERPRVGPGGPQMARMLKDISFSHADMAVRMDMASIIVRSKSSKYYTLNAYKGELLNTLRDSNRLDDYTHDELEGQMRILSEAEDYFGMT
jgi:hypothetical protein